MVLEVPVHHGMPGTYVIVDIHQVLEALGTLKDLVLPSMSFAAIILDVCYVNKLVATSTPGALRLVDMEGPICCTTSSAFASVLKEEIKISNVFVVFKDSNDYSCCTETPLIHV